MLKAKGEVLEALEKAESMTEAEFRNLVNIIASAYASVQGTTQKEIAEFKKEMMGNWEKLARSKAVKPFTKAAKKTKKTARNAAKKTSGKKATKKTPRKKRS